MKRSPQPRLTVVDEPPSGGDFEFYRARRLQKYGPPPPPPRVRAAPLERECLTKRSFADVVEHAIVERPTRLAPRWLLRAGVIAFALLLIASAAWHC